MQKCVIIILLAITVIIVGPAQATIVWLGCRLEPEYNPRHTLSWSFDYDLQKLTLSEIIYEFDPEWPIYAWPRLSVGGRVDDPYLDSTFAVELTITNETGIEWIGYKLLHPPAPASLGGAYIIPGSIETTKLQTITDTPSGRFFSEPPAVFDGESFTISFDMRTCETANSKGSFSYYVNQIPVYVPEPATIVLLVVGGLALLKKPKP
jgi:hypothetical protein